MKDKLPKGTGQVILSVTLRVSGETDEVRSVTFTSRTVEGAKRKFRPLERMVLQAPSVDETLHRLLEEQAKLNSVHFDSTHECGRFMQMLKSELVRLVSERNEQG